MKLTVIMLATLLEQVEEVQRFKLIIGWEKWCLFELNSGLWELDQYNCITFWTNKLDTKQLDKRNKIHGVSSEPIKCNTFFRLFFAWKVTTFVVNIQRIEEVWTAAVEKTEQKKSKWFQIAFFHYFVQKLAEKTSMCLC